MTVCIAATCDGGKSIVIAADRQITVSAINLQYDHSERKIDVLRPNLAMLSAGNALIAAEVFRRSQSGLGQAADDSFDASVVGIRQIFQDMHRARAEEAILFPRGWNWTDYKAMGSQSVNPQIQMVIDQHLNQFTLGTQFIVAGVDHTGAHITWLHDQLSGPGWVDYFDKLGYHTIGSGASHANIALSLHGQHRGLSLERTLYNVVAAKLTSEVAPGVGASTDVAVVSTSGIRFLDDSTLARLRERIHSNNQKAVVDDKSLALLADWNSTEEVG